MQCVNLFRYPSVEPRSGCKKYIGHASHVTRVRFMMNDNWLVSTGGNDKTNIIWTTDFGGDHKDKEALVGIAEDNEDDFRTCKPRKITDKLTGEVKESNLAASTIQVCENDLFTVEENQGGDEFMAVKPWLGAIKPPSNFGKPAPGSDKAPNLDVVLEYCYGYR